MSPIRYKKTVFSTSAVVFLAIVFANAVSVATVAQYYNFGNPAATDNFAAPSTNYPTASYPASPPGTGHYGGNTVPAFPAYQQSPPVTHPTFTDPNINGEQPYAGLPVGQPVPATPQQPSWPGQMTQPPGQGQVPDFNHQPQLPQPNVTGIPAHQPMPYATPPNDVSMTPVPMHVPSFDPTAGGNFDFDVPTFQPPQFTPPPPTAQGGDPTLLALGGIGNAYAPSSGAGQTGGAVPAFRTPGAQESLSNQGLAVRERERRDDRRQADQEFIDTWSEILDKKNTNAWMKPLPPYAGPLENRTREESPIMSASYFSHTIKQDDYEYDWEREEKHYFSLSMLDPTRFGERVKVWVGLGPDEAKGRKYMESALESMKKGDHIKAAKDFEWAAYYCPETALEEDARYHAAECYYREKQFNKAVNQYTKLLTNFPSSPYKSDAVKNTYEIARTWIKQVTEDKVGYVNVSDKSRPAFDTFGHAERALKTIFINCPNDPMADDSVFLLAHGYMRLGRVQGDASFEKAAEYFKQLRDCYPNSEFVVEAMRLEVICREKSGLGAEYDSRHIIEASKTAELLRLQHVTRMPSDQQNDLVQTANRLNEQMAQKLWVTGKFYDDRYDYGAARLLYRELIDTYPATEHAEKARKRYEQIRDLPDELPSDWQRIKSVFKIRWQ
ncbi:MAG: outer membrane protein assembly factor BamD [Planctomycetaceae bacterium]|nr:outer membrane protein assembly factor BamD [Planctomycetaceae bacterium]